MRKLTATCSLALLLSLSPVRAEPASCPGDCDGDGEVRVQELVRLVRAALDLAQPCLIEFWLCPPPDPCLGLDANDDGVVTADELTRAISRIVKSVRSALEGCP
jgi:hypothetical protein